VRDGAQPGQPPERVPLNAALWLLLSWLEGPLWPGVPAAGAEPQSRAWLRGQPSEA
jgi:hypothetical protein